MWTNIAILGSFAARYKDTIYADLARARIEDLSKKQAALAKATIKTQQQSESNASDAMQVWNATEETTCPAVLEDFIRQFGKTVYGSRRVRALRNCKQPSLAKKPQLGLNRQQRIPAARLSENGRGKPVPSYSANRRSQVSGKVGAPPQMAVPWVLGPVPAVG
jgi:hypothetical protein